MKHRYYFVLLIFLTSCAARPDAERSRVRLELRDSLSHEYYLLSVRDSGLVVLPGYYNLKGPAKFMPFSKISHVYYYTDGKTGGTISGGLIGCAVGVGSVLAIGLAQPSRVTQGGEGVAIAAAFIGMLAIIPGAIIGYLVSSDEDVFDLSKAHDRDALRQYSIFPDYEPPELQKIK